MDGLERSGLEQCAVQRSIGSQMPYRSSPQILAGRAVAFGDRYQIAVYLLALLAGMSVGLAAPASGPLLGLAIEPVLALLLFATFRQVPFTELAAAFRDGRFLAAILLVNFVVVGVKFARKAK